MPKTLRRPPRRNPRAPAGPTLPQSHNDCVLRTRPLSLVSPDGVIPLAKIGQGMFAAVYRETTGQQRVFAIVDEGVYDKEVAVMAHEDDPRNPHLPRVERFGMLTDNRSIFTMPFYTVPYRVANANPASRAAFTALRTCINSIFPRHDARTGRQTERGYETASRKLACIEEAGAKIPPKLVDAVRGLHEMSKNYGDQYDFEFSPRNVATDDQGKLVLLDVLFNRDNVDRVMKARLRKIIPSGLRSW